MDDNNFQQSNQSEHNDPWAQQQQNDFNNGGNGKGNSTKAIASLVLGILSIVTCCCTTTLYLIWLPVVAGIVGLVLGVMALKEETPSRGLAIAGIVTSIIGLVFAVLAITLIIIGSVWGDSTDPKYSDPEYWREFFGTT